MAIQLTNKTARALKSSAERMQKMYVAIAAVLTVVLIALAVWLSAKWMPAVPLLAIAAALLDTVILMHGQSVYVSLRGQAICTEAAAQELRAGRSNSLKREQAIADLMAAQADVSRMQMNRESAAAPKEASEETGAQAAPHRRRRADRLTLIRSGQAK